MTLLFFIMFASVAGVTWSMLLTQPGDLLDFVPPLVYRITKNKKVRKVAYECEKCVAGQVALWGYVIVFFECYSWHEHLSAVVFSIFGGFILGKVVEKWQN